MLATVCQGLYTHFYLLIAIAGERDRTTATLSRADGGPHASRGVRVPTAGKCHIGRTLGNSPGFRSVGIAGRESELKHCVVWRFRVVLRVVACIQFIVIFLRQECTWASGIWFVNGPTKTRRKRNGMLSCLQLFTAFLSIVRFSSEISAVRVCSKRQQAKGSIQSSNVSSSRETLRYFHYLQEVAIGRFQRGIAYLPPWPFSTREALLFRRVFLSYQRHD